MCNLVISLCIRVDKCRYLQLHLWVNSNKNIGYNTRVKLCGLYIVNCCQNQAATYQLVTQIIPYCPLQKMCMSVTDAAVFM